MKPSLLSRAALVCCWVLLPHGTLRAQDDAAKPAPDPQIQQIRVQVEWIEVSHEQLTALLVTPRVSPNDSDLRQQLSQLVKEGKASIVETMLCTAPSGEKATSDSIEEFIYPTEYEPPGLPCGGSSHEAIPLNPEIGPVPTAFETRNLGSTIEIEPKLIHDDKLIRIILTPEIVYHVGDSLFSEWKSDHGNSPVKMPLIYTLRFKSTIMLTPGKPMLAAALSPKDQAGFPDPTRKLMIFVRADVLTPDH